MLAVCMYMNTYNSSYVDPFPELPSPPPPLHRPSKNSPPSCIQTQTRMRIRTHMHAHTHAHARTHPHTHTRTHARTHRHTHTHTHLSIYTHTLKVHTYYTHTYTGTSHDTAHAGSSDIPQEKGCARIFKRSNISKTWSTSSTHVYS